jgi:hypothetical protein
MRFMTINKDVEKNGRGMSLIEVLLALCFFAMLILGAAQLIATLRVQLRFCEETNRAVLFARDRIEKILLDGRQAAVSGSESIQSREGFRFTVDWQIRGDVPAPGLGLLTCETAAAGRQGKLVCKTWIAR